MSAPVWAAETAPASGDSTLGGTAAPPSSTVNGSYIEIFLAFEKGTDISITLNGWTEVARANNAANVGVWIGRRVATGTGNVNLPALSTSAKWIYVLGRSTGENAAAPINITATANGASGNPDPASVDPTVAECQVRAFVATKTNSTFTAPSGYFEEFDAVGGAGLPSFWMGRKDLTGHAAENPGAVVAGTQGEWAAITYALAPLAEVTADIPTVATLSREEVEDVTTVAALSIPPRFTMAVSSHITASGEDTTAQLTAPDGKTTADFVAGRITDDENPTDSIDIVANKYTEVEFSIVSSEAAEADTYYFRVVVDGQPLTTYPELAELDLTAVAAINKDVATAAALSTTNVRDVSSVAALSTLALKDVTSAAALARTETKDVPSAAALATTNQRDVASTAALATTNVKDVSTTASLSMAVLADIASAAALSRTETKDVGTEAAIEVANSGTRDVATVAALNRVEVKDVPTAAALARTEQRDVTSEAFLSRTEVKDIASLAVLATTAVRDAATLAALSADAIKDATSVAVLSMLASKDAATEGRLSRTEVAQVVTGAAVAMQATADVPSAVALSIEAQKQIQTAAALTAVQARDIITVAALTRLEVKDVVSQARVGSSGIGMEVATEAAIALAVIHSLLTLAAISAQGIRNVGTVAAIGVAGYEEQQRALDYRRQQQARENNKLVAERALAGSVSALQDLEADFDALRHWEGWTADKQEQLKTAAAYRRQAELAMAGNTARAAFTRNQWDALKRWSGWDPDRRVSGDEE